MTKKEKEQRKEIKRLENIILEQQSNIEEVKQDHEQVYKKNRILKEVAEHYESDSKELTALKNTLISEYLKNTELDREQKRFVMKKKELQKEKKIATLKMIPPIVESITSVLQYFTPQKQTKQESPTPAKPVSPISNFCEDLKGNKK